MPTLIGIAWKKSVSAYVADGSNRWPAVPELDAAHLFRLALDAAPGGSLLHGVGDEGVPFRASPPSSAATSTCPWSASPAMKPRLNSASSEPWYRSTFRLQAHDPRTNRVAADAPRTHRRPRAGPLLQRLNGHKRHRRRRAGSPSPPTTMARRTHHPPPVAPSVTPGTSPTSL